MPCPDAIAVLVELAASHAHPPSCSGNVETMLAPGACLGCGGVVWYPFHGNGMPDGGMCRNCGRVDLVTLRGGFLHRFKRRGV